jgi:hypothetical protein
MRSNGGPFIDMGKLLRAFLKDPLLKKSWRVTQLEKKTATNNDWTANRTLSFERTSTQTGAVKQCQVQQMPTVSHIPCSCETLAASDSGNLG